MYTYNSTSKTQPNKKIGTRSELTFVQRKPTFGQQTYEKMLNITNHQGNASQNHSETSPHTCQNGYYQKEQITNIGKNVKKRVVGNVNWCSHYGTQYGGSSKN